MSQIISNLLKRTAVKFDMCYIKLKNNTVKSTKFTNFIESNTRININHHFSVKPKTNCVLTSKSKDDFQIRSRRKYSKNCEDFYDGKIDELINEKINTQPAKFTNFIESNTRRICILTSKSTNDFQSRKNYSKNLYGGKIDELINDQINTQPTKFTNFILLDTRRNFKHNFRVKPNCILTSKSDDFQIRSNCSKNCEDYRRNFYDGKINTELTKFPSFIHSDAGRYFNNNFTIKLKTNCVLTSKSGDFQIQGRRNYSKNSDDYNRHFYDGKIEELINDQINTELVAGYTYLNIAAYYGRSNVALPGFYGFFMKMHYEEQGHALGFIKYQSLRGGVVHLCAIELSCDSEWPDVTKSLHCALTMEKNVKEKLVEIFKRANTVGDTNVMDMLDTYIEQQEQSIYEMSRLLTRATELSRTEVGRYLFDRELHETYVKSGTSTCTLEIGNKLYK